MAHQFELGTLHYAVYMPYAESASTALIRVEDGPYVEDLKEAIGKHSEFKGDVESQRIRLYACGTLSIGNVKKTRYEAVIKWLQGDRDAHEMEPAFLLTKYKNIIPTPAEAEFIDVIVATDSILERHASKDDKNAFVLATFALTELHKPVLFTYKGPATELLKKWHTVVQQNENVMKHRPVPQSAKDKVHCTRGPSDASSHLLILPDCDRAAG
ncbi:hypothetical protein BDW22DRAFT_1348425 [Trametopsis cervina]|nr:hypothetical protein BDW22DRAFT_1348425 [Trametopsis cervina]